jgi:hypothetical protein
VRFDPRAGRVVVSALALAILGLGCPFDPREPIPPEDPIPAECRPSEAVNEIDVLTNLIAAFGCGRNGVDKFRQSHEPDFLFVPLASDDPTVVATINGWALLPERRDGVVGAFSQQITDTRKFVLSFDDLPTITAVPADEGRFLFDDAAYRLDILELDDTEVAAFGGVADIFIFQGDNGWALDEWRDDERGGVLGTLGNFYVNGPPQTP